MKYKPILFSSDMIKALINGKTVTRRIKTNFKEGDILYVREKFRIDETLKKYSYIDSKTENCHKYSNWKPSLHMPKEAVRFFLKVKNVSKVRLQDIDSEELNQEGFVDVPIKTFSDYWNSLVPKGKEEFLWENNPEVFRIEFENISREIKRYLDKAYVFSRLYYSTIIDFETDPYCAEDSAFFRQECLKELKKEYIYAENYFISKSIIDINFNPEIIHNLKKGDQFLLANKDKIIKRLSAISDMEEQDLEYIKSIKEVFNENSF